MKVKVPRPEQVIELTIWDNYERHCTELEAVGATDVELQELRKAAQAVDDARTAAAADEAARVDLALELAPVDSGLGFELQPPTKEHRFWVERVIMASAGGMPDTDAASSALVVAALHVLRLLQAGKAGQVMRLAANAEDLADAIAKWCSQPVADGEKVAAAYMRCMGLDHVVAKKKALGQYLQTAEKIAAAAAGRRPSTTVGSSPNPPPPGSSPDSPGPSTGPACPPGSLTP